MDTIGHRAQNKTQATHKKSFLNSTKETNSWFRFLAGKVDRPLCLSTCTNFHLSWKPLILSGTAANLRKKIEQICLIPEGCLSVQQSHKHVDKGTIYSGVAQI